MIGLAIAAAVVPLAGLNLGAIRFRRRTGLRVDVDPGPRDRRLLRGARR